MIGRGNKMIKKLLTLLAAGLLIVCMSITAWADEGNSQIPPYTYRIDSTYGSAESKEHLVPYTRKGQILYRVKMNGSYLKNQWVCLYTTYEDHGADSYIYLDEDGYSLDPGETKDGFTIGPFGVIILEYIMEKTESEYGKIVQAFVST